MNISIGHRLFVSVLLAILAVAAGAVSVLRQNVLAGFGDYAVGIELDRLDELSGDLLQRYRARGDWTFIAANARADWIAHELARLQRARERAGPAPPVPATPPVPPAPATASSAAPASSAASTSSPALDSATDGADGRADGTPSGASSSARAPGAAHSPAASPAPPAPPAPAAPAPPLPLPPAGPGPAPDDAGAPLARRITLFDARGRYLAGRDPRDGAQGQAQARRALTLDGRTVGWLGVARDARPTDALAYAFLDQLRSSLWLIAAGAVALSALAATLLARHFRRPIRALEQGAAQLSAGRFDVELKADRSDELGELARHFNTLARHLAGAEAARRQWVADTSHELRTPLAVLRAQLEAVQDGVRGATPDTLDAMLRQVLALNKLIDELYALARADVGALDVKPVRFDLWALAKEQAAAIDARLHGAGLVFDAGPAPSRGVVLADPDRMRQVLDNLLENSLRYTAAGGRVRLSAQVDGDHLALLLDDSAPGVPPAALDKLGERFYRVDASRSRAHGGAGLGLALCRRLLAAQGATLDFAASPLGGLRVCIRVPLAQDGP